ncbi:MAG: hypothetical protein PVF33_10865 [Candidatus Latescibacterota bacterium]|jgi:hypothetical protein
MPIQTRIDPDNGFRVHVMEGPILMDEVRLTLEETYAHPDFRPEADAMWDLTGATGDPATEEIRHLADFVGKLAGEMDAGKVALLVSEQFEFGLARMYESILAGQSSKPIMVFKNRAEAESWLSGDG